jgi:CRP-like cAMP-binding protein
VTVTEQDLARSIGALTTRASDYGAWLEAAAILGALGYPEDAEAAFLAVGEGACASGQVALAVACGRYLAEQGSIRGVELVEHVIDTYATGGPHFAMEKPVQAEQPLVEIAESGSPIDDARKVIATLGPWLAERSSGNVAPAPLLSALSKPGARALVGVMTARAYPAGATIVAMGDPALALYWLAHGSVAVSRESTPLGELYSGAFFGEIALVGGTHRTATVVAQSDVWLLEIPAKAVELAAAKQPQLAEVLAFHARARLLANLMRTSELFQALEAADRDVLLAKFTTEIVPAGTTLVAEGSPNDTLWVVVTGRCEVQAGGSVVAELGCGAAVGEISLVTGSPAGASVVAAEPAVVLKLAKRDFVAIAQKHPAWLAEVEQLAKAREQENRALFHDASDLIV